MTLSNPLYCALCLAVGSGLDPRLKLVINKRDPRTFDGVYCHAFFYIILYSPCEAGEESVRFVAYEIASCLESGR